VDSVVRLVTEILELHKEHAEAGYSFIR